MGDLIDPTHLIDSVNTWVGYLDDLGRVGFDDASTKLRLVVNYASKDRIVRPLTERLRVRFPREDFFERLGADDLGIPSAGANRLAFLFDLLVHLKSGHKITLRDLLTSRPAFAGGGLDHRWKVFQKLVVAPLRDEVAGVKEWLSDHLGDEPVDLLETFNQALSGGGGPAAASPPVRLAAHAARGPLGSLQAAVKAAGLGAGERDLLTDVEILGVELRKSAPSPERLGELVDGFRAAGAALGEAAAACLPATALTPRPPLEPVATEPSVAPAGTAELASERAALDAEHAAMDAQRAALDAERKALAAERAALAAEREALEAERRALESRKEKRA
jgi:hypothetical protein